jgi:hypothetical protein
MIADSTRLQAYQLRKGGARARLAILRMIAADSQSNFNPHTRLSPGDWRGARHWKLSTYESAYAMLSAGSNDGRPVWVSHAGPEFRREFFCDESSEVRINHTGWFTDDMQCDKARGIVARLPHGRFLAGYWLSMNDERVYFPEVHDNERDAAYAADEHARVIGEQESEYHAKWQEARDLECSIEAATDRIKELRRIHSRFACNPDIDAADTRYCAHLREEVQELCAAIRADRETLATEFKDYE